MTLLVVHQHARPRSRACDQQALCRSGAVRCRPPVGAAHLPAGVNPIQSSSTSALPGVQQQCRLRAAAGRRPARPTASVGRRAPFGRLLASRQRLRFAEACSPTLVAMAFLAPRSLQFPGWSPGTAWPAAAARLGVAACCRYCSASTLAPAPSTAPSRSFPGPSPLSSSPSRAPPSKNPLCVNRRWDGGGGATAGGRWAPSPYYQFPIADFWALS